MIGVARRLLGEPRLRWAAYELIRFHPAAFRALDDALLEALAEGLVSWDTVDAFGRILSGPAWVQGLASDALIRRWAVSPDRWLRRAALVSTVALNIAGDGGHGDAARTLEICERLTTDRDDMVLKALSWALRALVRHDEQSVRAFLARNETSLAPRVRREVGNKLRTGLKNPRRRP